ncbi:MAG TPA: carboxypeptidase-like regulatory domain-containing protein [Tenuifilaceae bacterium]|nr:carboxypeptidase-like regulatory domain-containing protein [Tenuifilaceae bacterium]
MRSKLIIILIFLIPTTFSFGQITITGRILSEEDTTELPGVSIIEFGTSNGVMADLNGNYKIVVSDTAKFLEYSYVGFVSRKVLINGQTVINTSLKPYIIYEAFDQKIGLFLQSGLVNTPYGAKFYYSTPVVGPLSVGFQVAYMTDFKLNQRFDAGLSFSSYRFMLRPGAWLYGSVDFNYRKLIIHNSMDMVSYSIENYAKIYDHNIILGLSKIEYSPENSDNNSGYGIIAGYKKDFRKLDYLTLTYKMGFYKETIEYHLQIDLPIKRVKTFLAFNKIDDYHEIMIGIGFNTYYYYRYQKNANKY